MLNKLNICILDELFIPGFGEACLSEKNFSVSLQEVVKLFPLL